MSCRLDRGPHLHVTDDADDLDGLEVERGEMDTLADRIFAGKVQSREGIVDDDDFWRGLVIARGEEAAAMERNLHRREVLGPDDRADRPAHLILRLGFRPPADPEQQLVAAFDGYAAERERRGLDAGRLRERVAEIVEG